MRLLLVVFAALLLTACGGASPTMPDCPSYLSYPKTPQPCEVVE